MNTYQNEKKMNVAVALNRKYFIYTYVMLTSLYENNKENKITVYVLHSELAEEQIAEFQSLAEGYGGEVVSVYVDRGNFSDQLPTTTEWTIEAYYRLMMPDLLPGTVERILYLDVDIIVNQNLWEFYCQEFEGKLFCVCKDPLEIRVEQHQLIFNGLYEQGFIYFNSGVMLWNMKEIRRKFHFADYMKVAKQLDYKMMAPDQDLLNYCHWREVKYADEAVYNQFARAAHNQGRSYEDVKNQVAILHYAGTKPWGADNIHFDIERIWWDYAKKTPYHAGLCEEFVNRAMTDETMEQYVRELMENNNILQQNLNDSLQLNQRLLAMISSNSTS